MLFGLAKEFHNLKYYDEELWELIVETAINKKKVNNLHYFAILYETLGEFDTNDDCPLKGRFTARREDFVKRHYTGDRKWRYSLADGGHWFSLKEMQDKREDYDNATNMIVKAPVD